MLYCISIGKPEKVEDLAILIGIHRQTITAWCKIYQEGGIEKLLDVYVPKGKVPVIIGEILEALKQKLSEPKGFASYEEIQIWLKNKFNKDFTSRMVFIAVHDKLKARPKVARPEHYKKDKIAAEAFKNGGCCEAIKKNFKI
jgi:putative transposase